MSLEREVVSLVKYISNIRPRFRLEELKEYLSEEAQVEELFRILRPHLFDLGLVWDKNVLEKLETQPLPYLPLRNLNRLSPDIEMLIQDYIEDLFGKEWYKGETGRLIRDNIVKQKEEYWRGVAEYSDLRVVSYLLYHFPVYFCQFQYVLLDMLESGLLSNRMSILDAGAGPGTITLSILDFIRKYGESRVSIKIEAVEQSEENIRCYEALTAKFLSKISNPNILVKKPILASLESAEADPWDLIVFSNVLTEMPYPVGRRGEIVARISKKAGENSSIVIIEPADLENSVNLRRTQQALIKLGYNVYSPCTPIWGITCREATSWSFDHFGDIEVPGFMRRIASEEPYRYINTDMKCSYAIIRKDGKTKHLYRVSKGDKFVRLSKLKKHVGKRVNIVVSLMSKNLGDEENLVYKVCDGTPLEQCYAVLPSYHVSPNNQGILEAKYSDILEIYGTLVRYNPKYRAYNMLITRDTKIEIVG